MARLAVIVTGASGGIGQALVNTFNEAGYCVIATDLKPAPSDLPAEHFISADLKRTVNEENYAAEVFTKIHRVLNDTPLKALINNAAIQILSDAETLSRQVWRDTLSVNLLAPFFWMQALLPDLQIANGCVVNIGSIHGALTKPRFSAYATSKAALVGLTQSLAVEWGNRIRVNAIAPAAIATPMLKAGFKGHEDKSEELAELHPVGRIGNVEEVARLALYLISDDAGFINGATFSIDGGISARLYDLL
jgi:NAD(P)-dependent dehydrogenase (short-subunit alcohol dehydrogenase family)